MFQRITYPLNIILEPCNYPKKESWSHYHQYLHVKPKQTEAITRGIAITNTLSKLFRVTLGKRIETS